MASSRCRKSYADLSSRHKCVADWRGPATPAGPPGQLPCDLVDGGTTVPGAALGGSGAPGMGRRPTTADDPGARPVHLDLDELEAGARARLPAEVVDYFAGGAGREIALGEATAAWREWRLRPRGLTRGGGGHPPPTLLGREGDLADRGAPLGHPAPAPPGRRRGTPPG